jgi:HK97 family phage prohead protease
MTERPIPELYEVSWTDVDLCILRLSETASDGRNLSGYVVPWNIPAAVLRPVKGLEIWRKGALTKSLNESKRAGRPIPLFSHHSRFNAVATMVDTHADDVGQHMIFRALDTAVARDALEEHRAGLLGHLSIGGTAIPARTKITRDAATGETIIDRAEAKVDHVGLVRVGAYGDAARVLVRSDDDGLAELDELDGDAARVRAAVIARARKAKRDRYLAAL